MAEEVKPPRAWAGENKAEFGTEWHSKFEVSGLDRVNWVHNCTSNFTVRLFTAIRPIES